MSPETLAHCGVDHAVQDNKTAISAEAITAFCRNVRCNLELDLVLKTWYGVLRTARDLVLGSRAACSGHSSDVLWAGEAHS